MQKIKNMTYNALRWSEKYTKTDMVYLFKGGSWLTLSRVVGSITALALATAYANLLPKDSYGLYRYVLSIFSIINILTLPGINSSITRSIVLGYEGSLIQGIKTKIKWSSLAIFTGLCISGYYFLNQNNVLAFIFLIASIFSPITSSLVFGPYLEGKKLFKTTAILSSLNQIILSILVISTLLIWPNEISLVLTYFTATFLLQLIFFLFVYKTHKLNDKKDPEMISLGKHFSFMDVLGVISNHIDKILMWHFVGPTQLAIYAFAIMPITQGRSFLKALPVLAYPKIAVQDLSVLKKTLPKKLVNLSLLLLIPVLGYIILAPFLFKILFPQYIDSVFYSQIFSLTLLLFPFRIFSHPLVAQAKKKSLYISKTIVPIIKIILLFTLLPQFGILGAILAIFISSILNDALTYYFFKKM